MLGEILSRMISFLEKEYGKSQYKRLTDSFFAVLTKREIPRIDWFSLPQLVVSPYLFVILFVVFLGLSDHALSFMGTSGVVLGLAGFIAGVQLKRLKRPKISKKYFYPLLLITGICAAGMFVDWSLFLKISLIPMVLLFLTGKYTREVFITVFLASLLVLQKGFWGVALPFTLISLIFLATTQKRAVFDDHIKVIAFTFIFAGGLFWVLDVLLFGGFPLLSPEARVSLDSTYTMLSHLLPIGCVMSIVVMKNRTGALILVVVSVVLMALLGYRTQVVLVMLASCFAAFLTKVITGTETVIVLAGTGGIGVVLTSLRDVVLQTKLGIFEAIQSRVSVTLDIYDMMANLGGFLGYTKGQVYAAAFPSFARLMPGYAYSPRWYVAELVGMNVSATSTILGPLALDFGLGGIIIGMGFLGYLLSTLYEKKTPLGVSLYCIVLAYALIGIETGIVDLEVIGILFLAFLYVLTCDSSKELQH